MENSIDKEFIDLYEETKTIIDRTQQLLGDLKNIDNYLNFGFVNEFFLNLLNTNYKNCEDLGEIIKRHTQKFVVIGETSAGKSSFINALIFQSNVLPTGSASTTKCFVEIKQNNNNTNYIEVNNQDAEFSKLEETVMTEINKENQEKAMVKVFLFYKFKESDYFANNITIDTPGIDYDEHYDEYILQYCNEADIVILVVNAINHIGKTMENFCRKFEKDLSKLNLYVVFNYCDVLQENDDWKKEIEEKMKILTKLFPSVNREKIALVSSKERMKIITNKEYLEEKSRTRNNAFQILSEQIQNERRQISNSYRFDSLRKILDIMNKNKLCFSQIMSGESVFFDNLKMLSNLPLFKQQIDKIVLSYCEIILKKSRKIISNKQTNCDVRTSLIVNVNPTDDENNDQNNDTTNDSDTAPLIINENPNDDAMKQSEIKRIQQGIQLLLNKVENEIKRKVMEEIINFIRSNIGDDKDTIIFVIKNIYFPTIMKKRYLVDYNKVIECVKEKSSRLKMGIGAAAGGLALGVACATIPLWPIMLPFELATGAAVGIGAAAAAGGITIGGGLGAVGGKAVNELSEKNSKLELQTFLKKCGEDLFNNLSTFLNKIRKYSDLLNEMQQITNEIGNFERKLDLFHNTCSISFIKNNEIFSADTFKSLCNQYNNVEFLLESPINHCLEIINKFLENKSKSIDCFLKEFTFDENINLSLNCLFVSINIISKYIENNQSSTSFSDSSLIQVFDSFFEKISSHHLAERICESILYAMCSLMKLQNKNVNYTFWKAKLEICFLNDKISEENRLASAVILTQMDMSNSKLLFKIVDYLFNKIDFDCMQEYFGFTKSEINSARRNTINNLKVQLETKMNNDKDPEFFIIHQELIIDLNSRRKIIESGFFEMNSISDDEYKSFISTYDKVVNKFPKIENIVCFNKNYSKFFCEEFYSLSVFAENTLFYKENFLNKYENENDCKYYEISKEFDCVKTSVIDIRKYLNEMNENNRDIVYKFSKENFKLAVNILNKFVQLYFEK